VSGVPANIFRAYDIRGVVGEGLCPEVMRQIGRAIGSEALDLGERCLIVGADARLSSPSLGRALTEGILASGCDVIDIGVVPTPLMYYATHLLPVGSGVMVTGSHNPGHYNGVKIVLRRQCLADNQVSALRERIHRGDLRSGRGHLERHRLQDVYVERIAADITLRRPFKVVVDAGNGVTGALAPRLFRTLGCEVQPLHCELDGRFPNHPPDPSEPGNLRDLRRAVRESGAALGIAFDGDGDRVVLVDEEGGIIDADQLLMCFALDILPHNPGAPVVYDIKSSAHLPRLVEAAGGRPVMCRSGHSFVKRSMQESGALLGGEYSAHIFFRHRWYGFDDGLYAAARFLEIMDREGCGASELAARLPRSFSTPELRIPVDEGRKFALMARLGEALRFEDARIETLDGIRADFPAGWGLLRASNTTPALVLRFEADTREELQRLQARFRQAIGGVDASLPLPF